MSVRNLTIRLGEGDPHYWINIILGTGEDGRVCGSLESNLKEGPEENERFDAAIDGMEGLVLALACAGVDVESEVFVEAILTTLDGIVNST